MKKVCLIIVVIMLFLFVLLLDVAFATYTSSEAYSRILKLKEQGKIPAYVVEQGTYKYVEGNSVVRVKGNNVNMRSQPKVDSRRITRWSINTELEYLGEWTHPRNGERWVCVRKNVSSEIGWILGRYIRYVKESNIATTKEAKHIQVSKSVENSSILSENGIDDEHNRDMNFGLCFLGVIVLGVAYVITSDVLGWEFSIGNFFVFLIHAFFVVVVVIVVCVVAYVILKFVWEEIILPILAVIFLFFGLLGGRGCGKTECPFYPRHNCMQCNSCPYV